MKIKAITLLLAAALPGFAFAEFVDFGTTTKPNQGGGFLVTGVFQGTPAAKLGLTKGDVITKLNGSNLKPTSTLARLIAGVFDADKEVAVDWTRGDQNMTGKVALNSTLNKEEFEDRYPDKSASKIRNRQPMILGGNLDDLDKLPGFDNGLKDLKNLGVDIDKLQKQLEDALAGAGMGQIMRSASTSFNVMRMATSPTGSKVTVSGTGGKFGVKIESRDGEIIFDEKISKEELDKVPAEEREFVKGLMGNDMNVIVRGAGNRGTNPDVEESVTDLLKRVEEEKKDDE